MCSFVISFRRISSFSILTFKGTFFAFSGNCPLLAFFVRTLGGGDWFNSDFFLFCPPTLFSISFTKVSTFGVGIFEIFAVCGPGAPASSMLSNPTLLSLY